LAVFNLPARKISTFLKFKMAAAAILKIENGHITAKVWPIAAKFRTVTHFGHLEPSHPYSFHMLKIQDGSSRHLEK